MSWRKANMLEYAGRHGKPDIERLGLFIEMPYLLGSYPKTALKMRGSKRMLADGPKTKDALGWCYFDKQFKRLFIGEAISRKKKRKEKKDEKKKPVFMPPTASKKLVGSGEYWGTFAGIIEALDWKPKPEKKKKDKEKTAKRNPMTNPAKFGGPGYADFCFSKWPEHLPEPYPPQPKSFRIKGAKPVSIAFHSQPLKTVIFPHPFFDENPYINIKGKPGPVYVKPKPTEDLDVGEGRWIPVGPSKWQGGTHDGCFEPFPPYFVKQKKRRTKKPVEYDDDRPPFGPLSYGYKKMLVENIMGKKVDIAVNATNFRTYQPTYVKYLI